MKEEWRCCLVWLKVVKKKFVFPVVLLVLEVSQRESLSVIREEFVSV